MFNKILKGKYALVVAVGCFYLCLCIIIRFILFFSIHASSISLVQFAGLFLIGLLYDLAVASFIILPFVLHLWLQNDIIYRKKLFPVVCIFFAGLISLLLFTSIVPKDFSPPLYNGLIYYLALRFIIYIALFILPPAFRIKWRTGVLYSGFSLVAFLLLFNAVSEWFFWQEFASRYNFIAVDYLVYTTEVLGNIKESYPIGWIILLTALATAGVVYTTRKTVISSATATMPFLKRSLLALRMLILPALTLLFLPEKWRHFSDNEYANSLAGDGLYEFAVAFQQNELDFYKYYQTLPDSTAFRILRHDLATSNSHFVNNDPYSIEREISYPEPERKLNVVLISVESLSAEFMSAFGNKNNITPGLDSLALHSLFFTNLYASGTRTVRGLESLSLSIPPTPGQSLVKRPDNANLFSLGSVFRSKGYTTQYIYGGYSYFDNMKAFFSNNNYQVIDRSAIPASKVHYQNIWGVADEDLFTLALQTLDSNAASRKPFFTHIMTVSNHRPYTYPENRIDISPSTQTRDGAVKYTDYAISKFLKESSAKPWFNNTIFVIVADHCAGSAGSVELPVTGYHIPMLIYAPALLQPQKVEALTAQIDIAPTILGLLKFRYRSKFFGQDVFNTPAGNRHAFISTYQGLGFLKNGQLIIQSPVKKITQHTPDFLTGNAVDVPLNDSLSQLAISYYQCAGWLLKHKKQNN
jgi:phosphoglycerol transferase MdoB-like AlkP superfamily enzyme